MLPKIFTTNLRVSFTIYRWSIHDVCNYLEKKTLKLARNVIPDLYFVSLYSFVLALSWCCYVFVFSLIIKNIILFDKVCQYTCGRSVIFWGYSSFSTPIKTYRHDMAEILSRVALNTITLTPIYFPWSIKSEKSKEALKNEHSRDTGTERRKHQ